MVAPVRQSAFTILTPLPASPLIVDKLIQALAAIDPVTNPHHAIPFGSFPELHYCSFVLVADREHPYLAFEGNLDGDAEPFLRKLADPAAPWYGALAAVYQDCVGFAGAALADYLLDHDVGQGTWYVGFRGRSAQQIRREKELRAEIGAFLDAHPALLAATPAEVRGAIQAHLRGQGLEPWAADAPQRPFLVRLGRRVLGALVLAAVGLAGLAVWAAGEARVWVVGVPVAAVVAALLYLRWLEWNDREDEVRWDQVPIADSDRREDRTFQNHMCSVTQVKAGLFRRLVLRLSLGVVGLAHRLYFNRGELGGIPTIHFARWVVTPDGRQVLFFSNFDGSWERYLGDFIEQARRGLNAIWSNTLGYPKTFGLVGGGAEDEERFKAFARNSMHRTRVWYAADPDLSVQNIRDNARIREEAFAPLREQAERSWLRLL